MAGPIIFIRVVFPEPDGPIIEMNSPYNDGYLAWGIKQDLYLLKFMLDKVIADAPTFVGEDEWLKDKEQEVMMEILKK